MSQPLPIKFSKPPAIPRDSLILITGVNGLIGSHVADQALAAGYRVRGTVRSKERCAWLEPLFASRHADSADRFELVEVPVLAAEGAWDDALLGVAGVVSVATSTGMRVTDVDKEVQESVAEYINLFAAAKAQPGVKAVVFTSSAWAAWIPEPNVATVVNEQSYNDRAVQIAADETLSPQEKGLAPFMTIKARVEKAVWDWVEREKPVYAFNSLLLDTVIGPILDPKNQPASTAGMVRSLYRGENLGLLGMIKPQWFIDARDAGRLYLAALTTGVTGWRVYGCAQRYSWAAILEILKSLYPEKKDFVNLPDAGWDHTDIQSDKHELLLRVAGQAEWTSLEQSVRDTAESFLSRGSS
ncbi:hypothetical protein B0H63DRAFT_15701 [Podospora didyma]|uniref:NAD-dependent epimerase/dehydratase domain-containing protein n=1 Tax=Podospora didyma TaxID=330526 RepID=A0AAE0P4W0_9PEZI|nr:hypothetical protein B0H63DRAFT_15701 [Podospora didyma]